MHSRFGINIRKKILIGQGEINGLLICGARLTTNVCQGKRDRKAIMIFYPEDRRHFRAFINEPRLVNAMNQLNISFDNALALLKEKGVEL